MMDAFVKLIELYTAKGNFTVSIILLFCTREITNVDRVPNPDYPGDRGCGYTREQEHVQDSGNAWHF